MRVSKSTVRTIVVVAALMLACWSSLIATVEKQSFPARQPIKLSPEATEFLRATILLLVPHSVVDEDDWGRTKRIQSGLNVRLDGAQLRTSRRWKDANHGKWKWAEITLLDPAERFELQVGIIPQEDATVTVYRVQAKARVQIEGRQQRWVNGVKVYSVSGEAIADVSFSADVDLQRSVVKSEGSGRLRILPSIKSASVRLNGFRLQRVGHSKGAVVREFGRSLNSVARRLVAHQRHEIAAKLNSKIQKEPERFEIPLGVFAVLAGPSREGLRRTRSQRSSGPIH